MKALKNIQQTFLRVVCVAGLIAMPFIVYQSPLWLDRAAQGRTPGERLLYQASNGDARGISDELAAGGSVNCGDVDGKTPLHCAVMSGSRRAVLTLLDAGADANSRSSDGTTPLMLALSCQHSELVALLLKRGADPNLPAAQLSPLYVASLMGDDCAVADLLEAGADANGRWGVELTPLVGAVCGNDTRNTILCRLIRAGADVNGVDANGSTPLMAAAKNGRLDAVLILLKAGADPVRRNHAGDSARTLAMRCENWSVVELLQRAERRQRA